MKKLNLIIFGTIMIIAIFMLTGSIYAYTGEIDPQGNISISETVTQGKGLIDITSDVNGYRLDYQWVEIDNNLYNELRKIKNELQVIEYFNLQEATGNTVYEDYYLSAQEFYKSLYGTYVEDFSDQKVIEDYNKIASLLPEYGNAWTRTTDNTFEIDLASFSGEKKYVLWVQLEKRDGTKVYEAEIYELTGTKQNVPDNEGNNQEDSDGNKSDNDKTDQENPDNNKQDNSKPDNNKDNTNDEVNKKQERNQKNLVTGGDKTTVQKILPKTGITNIITGLGLIVTGMMAVVSFRKYRKIK